MINWQKRKFILKNSIYIYGSDSRNFSGLIYASDYNTEFKKESNNGSVVANKIISDFKFDSDCDKLRSKKKENKYE